MNRRKSTSFSFEISLSIPLHFFVLRSWNTANTKPPHTCLCRKEAGNNHCLAQLRLTWTVSDEQSQNEGQRKNWVRSVKAPLTSHNVPSDQGMRCAVVGDCIVDTPALSINRKIWFWKQINKSLSSGLKQTHFRAVCNCHWSLSQSPLLISISEKEQLTHCKTVLQLKTTLHLHKQSLG